MLWIQENQRVTVWDVKREEKFTEVRFSSGRKDKKTEKYVNSTWSFVRFVGEAHKKTASLKKGDRIELKGAGFSSEPYEKDGETLYPKTPKLVVFNYEPYIPEDSQATSDASEIDEDEMPDFLR